MNPTPTWRPLFAAALLAAAFSSSARADERDYNHFFDGSIQHNGQVVAPAGGAIPRAGTGPAGPAAMPQDRMDKCLVSAGLGAQDLALYREMVVKLQTSEHGAEILQKIVADCESSNNAITVEAPAFKGSAVINTNGLEGIVGVGGESQTELDRPRTFEFNHKYVEFTKHDAAVRDAAAVMGHELTHQTLHAEFRRDLSQYADVLMFSQLDEENARVRGFLVAYEMSPESGGDATAVTRQAMGLAENPDAYFDKMGTWDPYYAVALDQSDLRDPVTAYQARLKKLEDAKKDDQDTLDELPSDLARVDHLIQTHADVLKALEQDKPAALLRARWNSLKETIPHELEDADKSIARVNTILERLNGPDGPALKEKLKALSYEPAFAAFVARNSEDIQRLQQLVHDRKLKVPGAGEQPMGDATFTGLFNALHGDKAADSAGPWAELNPTLDSLKQYALPKSN